MHSATSILYVPVGSLESYKTTGYWQWRVFGKIIEGDGSTGLADVKNDFNLICKNNEIEIRLLETESLDFSLINLKGQVLWEQKVSNLCKIPTQNLMKGIYFVKAGSRVQKIIVL